MQGVQLIPLQTQVRSWQFWAAGSLPALLPWLAALRLWLSGCILYLDKSVGARLLGRATGYAGMVFLWLSQPCFLPAPVGRAGSPLRSYLSAGGEFVAGTTHPVGNCQSQGSAHTCLASHNGPIVPERARRRLPAAPWALLTLCLPSAGCGVCVGQEVPGQVEELPPPTIRRGAAGKHQPLRASCLQTRWLLLF